MGDSRSLKCIKQLISPERGNGDKMTIPKNEAQRIIQMKVEKAKLTFCPIYTKYYPEQKKWMGFSFESIKGTAGHPALTVEIFDGDSLFPFEVHVGNELWQCTNIYKAKNKEG